MALDLFSILVLVLGSIGILLIICNGVRVYLNERNRKLNYLNTFYARRVLDERRRCEICKESFVEFDKVSSCPLCETLFHYDHLKLSLIHNTECPICDYKINSVKSKIIDTTEFENK